MWGNGRGGRERTGRLEGKEWGRRDREREPCTVVDAEVLPKLSLGSPAHRG